jgi:hypothetical protein
VLKLGSLTVPTASWEVNVVFKSTLRCLFEKIEQRLDLRELNRPEGLDDSLDTLDEISSYGHRLHPGQIRWNIPSLSGLWKSLPYNRGLLTCDDSILIPPFRHANFQVNV